MITAVRPRANVRKEYNVNDVTYNNQHSDLCPTNAITHLTPPQILGTEIDVSIGTIRREREAWRGRFFPKSPSTNGAALAVGAAVPPPRIPLVPGVYPPGGISSHSNVYSPEAGSLISRERLGRQAVQISRSYAILTAYGMGISGRVYAPGLHIHRYVLLEAYDNGGGGSIGFGLRWICLRRCLRGGRSFLGLG